jgi:hypothetical protein
MVDSIKSNRDEDEEEVEEPEQGFEIEKVDQVIEIVPSRTPAYDAASPVGEPADKSADIQLKALYEGEGVSPPHYDERAPVDGAESEGGDEEDEDEGFQQQNFVSNDLVFTQGSAVVTEHRETLDLGTSTTQHYYHQEEFYQQEGDEEEREAEGQL